jgi:hypothetical protein
VGATEYARPDTGARITRSNSANGALPIRDENNGEDHKNKNRCAMKA